MGALDLKRRGFFASLLAGPAAAKLLADVPEPKTVNTIELSPDWAYALQFDRPLRVEALEHIRSAWKAALGPNAPRLIILDNTATLTTIDRPSPASVTFHGCSFAGDPKQIADAIAGRIEQL